jgi:hypothetical protein
MLVSLALPNGGNGVSLSLQAARIQIKGATDQSVALNFRHKTGRVALKRARLNLPGSSTGYRKQFGLQAI